MILVVAIGGYFVSSLSLRGPSKDVCLGFKDIKNTYCDSKYGFALHYPESYKEANSYAVDEVVFMDGPRYITVYAETGPNSCHLNLCDRAATSHEIYNGVTWDFLGPANACDGDASGGGCNMDDVFRTKNQHGTIYIQSTSRSESENILKTFRFI